VARNTVHVRDALPEDAHVLVDMWRGSTETSGRLAAPDVESAQRAIGHLALDADQRLVVAETHDEVAGVAYLVRAPLSPIHEEATVRVNHLFVAEGHRRRGVGRALLGAAAAWADEKQIGHLMVNVSAAARDANRFLARLGIVSIATVRAVRVCTLQERLAMFEAADATNGHMMVERIRTLRRRQASARAGRRLPVE
jgi:GNAT superfamily N-acetyltransferase